jgi:hypothetical protein
MMEYNAAEKYRRLLRTYGVLERISTDNGNSISNTDARDAVEEFFNQCYHFKDWIKKDPSIKVGQNVEEFINSSLAMQLAADYCNSLKHAGLDRVSRSGKTIERVNTHMKIDLTSRGFVASSRLELTISGQSYDAFKLATECVEAWEKYLRENNISFPAP